MSALQNTGIDELLEALKLQSEMLELQAPVNSKASGVIVEAHLDKSRGPISTIMVTQGSLSVGSLVVAGSSFGRVRGMKDYKGQSLKKAGASTPVEVIGFQEPPMAGDLVYEVPDEKLARHFIERRQREQNTQIAQASGVSSLEDLLNKVNSDEIPQLSIILKADTQGTAEAINDSIAKLKSKKVAARVIHKAVGGISESDLNLAATSGAVVLGFNVRASRSLQEKAEKNKVNLQYFSIIYELIESIKKLMVGKLPPVCTQVVQGHAEVRNPISVPKVGIIAGSSVLDGKVTRNCHLRVIRDDVVIHDGKILSLRRFKDDVKEVQHGYECGISIDGFNDLREGDLIESYVIEESKRN